MPTLFCPMTDSILFYFGVSEVENLCGFKLPIFERINWHLTVFESPSAAQNPNQNQNQKRTPQATHLSY